MRFIQRLGYYLGGFAIGLIVLAYFLSGKDASCDYGPNARTVKNISSKPLEYRAEAIEFLSENQVDSITVVQLIRYGNVDFSKSDTKRTPCNIYHIDNTYKKKAIALRVENCDSIASLLTIQYTLNQDN